MKNKTLSSSDQTTNPVNLEKISEQRFREARDREVFLDKLIRDSKGKTITLDKSPSNAANFLNRFEFI